MNNCNLNDLCWGGKWVEVREFLDSDSTNKDKKRELVRYRGEDDWTCLHAACCFGAPVDIIESLLDIGGKELVMMITTHTKRTSLHFACRNGASFDIMKMLIDLGGKELIMAKNSDGDTALHSLCRYIKKHTKAAIKIKLMLQVPGTEIILTEKNKYGNRTPLDCATANKASDEIKALLQPRTIKNEPANASDDASNLVPADDQSNDTTITRLQNDLQAAKQRNVHLESQIESQKTQIETQKTKHQKTIADLETEIVLLSQQSAKQDKDNTYWKDRVENLTTLCSERKAEVQELKDSTRGRSVANAKRERDVEDDDDQDNSSSHARSSKRSRIGPTANEMHAEEDDVETVMEALLQEKQQHIHEKEQHVHEKKKNMKLMMELREVRKKLRLEKR